MKVNLSESPDAARTYSVEFRNLSGGLNLRDLPMRLKSNESPNMENMWWKDGVLRARDGQQWVIRREGLGTGFTCYEDVFWGHTFLHIGSKLYYYDSQLNDAVEQYVTPVAFDHLEVPENRGTFFRYRDYLFYKNKGGFFRIQYNPEYTDVPFSAYDVTQEAHTPTIVINADPKSAAGDTYQPENRLSGLKKIRYIADGGTEYKLPVTNIGDVDDTEVVIVEIDGVEAAGFSVHTDLGTVTFNTAPAKDARVEITYRKDNPEALNSVMDCCYATSAGSDQNLCILLAGCDAQPNAVFWNSNDEYSMDYGYWPMTNYNLVGSTSDPVTGFGKQYSDLLVFQQNGIGRLEYTVEDVGGRHSISFTYTPVNAKIGCDLPWTIQTIENNVVFCNTGRGVHIVTSSSSAFENNVVCISDKVNGRLDSIYTPYENTGFLAYLRFSAYWGLPVTSFDDDNRYWVCCEGPSGEGFCWVWDYSISDKNDPSWFPLTGICAAAFFRDSERRAHHLGSSGKVSRFVRTYNDYGESFRRAYQFPVMDFGSYVRRKDITSMLLGLRSDVESQVEVQYLTDSYARHDESLVDTWLWTWENMDLSGTILGYYNLRAPRFAKVTRRNPGVKDVQHFSFRLVSNEANHDLAIIYAQVLYKFKGKER